MARPSILLSANGRRLVFESFADDLVEGDYNLTTDIFSLDRGGEDADADGMEDDWERSNFATLDRDGMGDWDGDGHTDLDEYRTGTRPTDPSSNPRAIPDA